MCKWMSSRSKAVWKIVDALHTVHVNPNQQTYNLLRNVWLYFPNPNLRFRVLSLRIVVVLFKVLHFLSFPSAIFTANSGWTSTQNLRIDFFAASGPKESGSDEWRGQVFWVRRSFRPRGVHERHKAPLSAPSVSDTRLRWHAFQRGTYAGCTFIKAETRRPLWQGPADDRKYLQRHFSQTGRFPGPSLTAPGTILHGHY